MEAESESWAHLPHSLPHIEELVVAVFDIISESAELHDLELRHHRSERNVEVRADEALVAEEIDFQSAGLCRHCDVSLQHARVRNASKSISVSRDSNFRNCTKAMTCLESDNGL